MHGKMELNSKYQVFLPAQTMRNSQRRLPSIHEIFGMVMLEAMYFGAPVITSKNGGSSTLISSEEYGQMMPEYDPDRWAGGICRYIHNTAYREQVMRNCKKLIRDKYTWDTICRIMLNNIEGIG